jgi:hypothetical protein
MSFLVEWQPFYHHGRVSQFHAFIIFGEGRFFVNLFELTSSAECIAPGFLFHDPAFYVHIYIRSYCQ